MAERQYIGARYVPKLFKNPNGSCDWLSGIPYEPLTIVTYLGSSYTSRKQVPVGIDILNTEYWALTGNYNAQIDAYREVTEEYKEIVDSFIELAEPISLTKYGTSYADMQKACDEASSVRPIIMTQNITLGEFEKLNITDCTFIGNGFTIYATPHNVESDTDSSVAYESIVTNGDCVIVGVTFSSDSIYRSYQSKNNNGTHDLSSNRYGVKQIGNSLVLKYCTCNHMGMVYGLGYYTEIGYCKGNYSEMFVLGGTNLNVYGCFVAESTNTLSPYYHVFYTPNCTSCDIRDSVFSGIGDGEYIQDVFHFYSSTHSGSAFSVIKVSNCFVKDKINGCFQIDYGTLTIDNVYCNSNVFLSGANAKNQVFMNNITFTQNNISPTTNSSIFNLMGLFATNCKLYLTTRIYGECNFTNCSISGTYVIVGQSNKIVFSNCYFDLTDAIWTLSTNSSVNRYFNCEFYHATDTETYLCNDVTGGSNVFIDCIANGFINIARSPSRGVTTISIFYKLNAESQYKKFEQIAV